MDSMSKGVGQFLHRQSGTARVGVAASLLAGAAAIVSLGYMTLGHAQSAAAFNRSTFSSPIAMSADNKLVWVVDPTDDSVSVIRTDTNVVIKKIKVGDEPQSIALDPSNQYAYVANAASSNVSVIKITNANANSFAAALDTTVGKSGHLTTGAEPWNIVISPNGKRVFVANSAQDTISVINAQTRSLIGHVDLRNSLCNDPDRSRHFQPRGLAVTQSNDRLLVTQFLSFVKPGGTQGTDNGKDGVVCRLNINTDATSLSGYQPAALIRLSSRVTGFEFPGLAGATSAYPNQLQSVVIRGNQAYLPNIAASPNDPLRFNIDTHSFVNIIDNAATGAEVDASQAKFFLGAQGLGPNLHLGARTPEPGKKKLFFANPWAIGFTNQSGTGAAYVVSAASDLLVKVNVAANGSISFTGGNTTTRYIDLNDPENPATAGANAGKNPQGIVINDAGTTAYVTNFVSHNVSVVNLTTDSVSKVIKILDTPSAAAARRIAVGAEMFFSSRGHFDRPAGTTVSTDERLSSEGWQACSSCHFKGLTDGVVWVFNTGPRKSVPLNATFSPKDHIKQRILNYSGVFDEVQDFENNIRNISGPGALFPPVNGTGNNPNQGLMFRGPDDVPPSASDINQAPIAQVAFNVPNSNRSQHTVTLPGSTLAVPALDALNEWVRFAVRTPNAPLNNFQVDGGVPLSDILQGRLLFRRAGCQSCHGGDLWTSSVKNYVGVPPASADIATEAGAANTVGNQFLNAFLRDIGSFNIGVAGQGNALGNNIGAIEKATRAVVAGVLQADLPNPLGIDHNGDGKGNGFSPPSLAGLHALQPYYHNGACETLACVLEDVNHRTNKGQFTDVLAVPSFRAKVVRFLESIDATTRPF